MKYIKLTRGQHTVVDDDKYELLNKHKWCAAWNIYTKSFYVYRSDNGYMLSMARVILGLKRGDKHQPDHIDHNTLDNRLLNLRIVTHQQNSFNIKNTKGYYWHKKAKKYLAQITVSGKNIYLGLFQTAEEARDAYLQAKSIYHVSIK